jgi:hypothetical protein
VGVLAFAATLSRRTVLVLAGLTIVALAVTTLLAPVRQELVAGAREKASAFAPGSAEVPPGRTVIADLGPQSASVHEVAEGLFVARFLAPGDYAFMVGCSGRIRPWTYEFDPSGLELLRRAIDRVVAARPAESAPD